jgi:hypothetical protein
MSGAVSLVAERALQVGGSFEAGRMFLVVQCTLRYWKMFHFIWKDTFFMLKE